MNLINPQAQQFIKELKEALPSLIFFSHESTEKEEWIKVRYNWKMKDSDELKKSDFMKALSKLGSWANDFTLVIESDMLMAKIPLEISNDEVHSSGYFEKEDLAFSLIFEFGFTKEQVDDIPKLAKVSKSLILHTASLVDQEVSKLKRLSIN